MVGNRGVLLVLIIVTVVRVANENNDFETLLSSNKNEFKVN